eukprot:TRINITY_DN26309_c0_g1_i1.p1 TRINITY_DN26309_c0_g1~~TRINITY_DN26309_c0_g1_i1.p1  ORF type:complete len:674 (+),score=50.89 TRINITY_DN26309_c0_g1_i1:74-2023(+)
MANSIQRPFAPHGVAPPLSVLPAWREEQHDAESTPCCTLTVNVNNVNTNFTRGSSPRFPDDNNLADVEAQLVGCLQTLCLEVVGKFEQELHKQIKHFEYATRAVHRSADRNMSSQSAAMVSMTSMAKSAFADRSNTMRTENTWISGHDWNAGPDQLMKSRIPITLPTGSLQIAALESQVAQGKLTAEEDAIGAGFLGGGGCVTQVCWFMVGLYFVYCSFIDATPPHKIGHCGDACRSMLWLYRLTAVPGGLALCARGLFLRMKRYTRAYYVLLFAIVMLGPVHAVLSYMGLFLSLETGCDWRSDAYVFKQASQELCRWISLTENCLDLVCGALLLAFLPALWTMRKTVAERLFAGTFSVILFACVFRICALLRIGGASVKLALTENALQVLCCACLLFVVVSRRFRARWEAWQLVKGDAVLYDEEWSTVLEEQGPAIDRLCMAANNVAREIKRATQEGPRRHLRLEENVRRSLLHSCQESRHGLQQELSSLPLLYVQAFEIDSHFQCKCADWAAGAGLHIASSVKQPERAIQKVWRTYGGQAQFLVDLVRCSIVCETPDDIAVVLGRVQADHSARILRIKNRFNPLYNSVLSGGYRNLSLNVIIVDVHTRRACSDRHICELQLALRSVHDLKTDGGHRHYVEFRDRRAE